MARGEARVVLITGATGRIGAEVARAVLAAGGRVAAPVRRPWQVEKLRDELDPAAARDGRLLVGLVGTRDSEAAAGFVKGANDALGRVGAFVGTAGMLRERVPGKEPAGDLEELLDANLWANATMARALLPSLRRRGGGALLFVGAPADAGLLSANCRASKAALVDYVAALRADLDANAFAVQCLPVPLDDEALVAALARDLAARATA